jgi:hypothetical protein
MILWLWGLLVVVVAALEDVDAVIAKRRDWEGRNAPEQRESRKEEARPRKAADNSLPRHTRRRHFTSLPRVLLCWFAVLPTRQGGNG